MIWGNDFQSAENASASVGAAQDGNAFGAEFSSQVDRLESSMPTQGGLWMNKGVDVSELTHMMYNCVYIKIHMSVVIFWFINPIFFFVNTAACV
jgi:hypothetical protein